MIDGGGLDRFVIWSADGEPTVLDGRVEMRSGGDITLSADSVTVGIPQAVPD